MMVSIHRVSRNNQCLLTSCTGNVVVRRPLCSESVVVDADFAAMLDDGTLVTSGGSAAPEVITRSASMRQLYLRA